MGNNPAVERLDRAFHVRTADGTLLESFDEEAIAVAYAADANARATNLGVTTRYAVVPKS